MKIGPGKAALAKLEGLSADAPHVAEQLPALSRMDLLYREHNSSLTRFLRSRLQDDAEAQEVAQESYVRLLQLDPALQPLSLRAYLFKIAANLATDSLRRNRTRTSQLGGCFETVDPAVQERSVVARQRLQVVSTALTELPPRCREAFLLSRDEELGTAEISIRLGVSDRMVRLYLMRAMEHLQAALDRVEGGEART